MRRENREGNWGKENKRRKLGKEKQKKEMKKEKRRRRGGYGEDQIKSSRKKSNSFGVE
jgi:hypothetical protein